MGIKAKFVIGEKVYDTKRDEVVTIVNQDIYEDYDGDDEDYGPIYLRYVTYDVEREDGTIDWVFEKNLEPLQY